MTACRCAIAARLAAGPTIFLNGAREGAGHIEHRIGQKLLQLRVLLLQGPEPLRLGNVRAARRGLPIVDHASDTSCLRAKSAVFAPASCSFNTPIICSSVNLARFICPSFFGPDSSPIPASNASLSSSKFLPICSKRWRSEYSNRARGLPQMRTL